MYDAEKLFDLSEDEVDALPFGLISVDHAGNIEQYNSYESRLARLPKDRVLGRNFFRDVAPCTAVQEFERPVRNASRAKRATAPNRSTTSSRSRSGGST